MNITLKTSAMAGALALALGLGGCAQTSKIPYVGAALSKGTVAMQKVFGNETGQLSFASGSARIDEAKARDALQPFVDELSQLPNGGVIKIVGHTDSRGQAAKNQALSLARANAVKAVLVDMGVDASQVETVGRGEADAIANNATAQGRALNRRVEITLTRS